MAHAQLRVPSPTWARILIIAAAILWSTGGAAIKASGLETAQIAGGRALVTAVVLSLILLLRNRPNWRSAIVWAGSFYALTNILFVFANTHTTAGASIFLQNIAPAWVLLLSPFWLNERPTRPEIWSVPISLIGSALFFVGEVGEGQFLGNSAAIGASLSYAMLVMSYRRLNEAQGLAATIVGSLMVVAATAPSAAHAEAALSLKGVGAVIYLGAIQQSLAAVLFIRGIKGVSALEGVLLILLEPLLSPLWAYFMVGELMSRWAIAGSLVILSSTMVRTLVTLRSRH